MFDGKSSFRILQWVLLVLFCGQAAALDLVTVDGRTYKNIRLRSLTDTGIHLVHDSGAVFLDYLMLTDDDRLTFGYSKTRYEAAGSGVDLKPSASPDPGTKASASTPVPTPKPESKKNPPQGAQCTATTKKGTQCTRKAAPGSSFCWQHQM